MLTTQQLALVKATVPVLQQHGEEITRVFYGFLFEEHPELNNIFNPANQRDGGQARSLAAAICAYAAHIDQLSALGDMVGRIAHKHASLEVKAEHYPIVGKHLLRAIRAVLGAAATDEIIDAWAAAYGQLAEIMIGVEGGLYKSGAQQTGGWSGFKPFVVERKVPESQLITSFYLRPADGAPLPAFQPGQYVSVQIDNPSGMEYTQIRQYSLSDAPNGKYYRISVKREPTPPGASEATPEGAVSNHLHDRINEGDLVHLHAPLGNFVPDESSDRPVVLLGGGVGATPLLSMLRYLAQKNDGRPVLYVHATLGREHHAFRDEVTEILAQCPAVRRAVFYTTPGADDRAGEDYEEAGLIHLEKLRRYLPAGDPAKTDYYLCGPAGFMRAAEGILDELAVPAARRHSEVFGPSPSFASLIPTVEPLTK